MNKSKLNAGMHVHRFDSPSAILIPLAKKNKVCRSHTYGFDTEVNQILSILSYSLPMGSKDMQVFENFKALFQSQAIQVPRQKALKGAQIILFNNT